MAIPILGLHALPGRSNAGRRMFQQHCVDALRSFVSSDLVIIERIPSGISIALVWYEFHSHVGAWTSVEYSSGSGKSREEWA